jgi:hypothetical protein
LVSEHIWLDCTCLPPYLPSPSSVTTDILVDPFFLDAFQQQPSSPTYDKLLAGLPRAFVGTAAELKQLVALLTAQSMKAYADNVSVERMEGFCVGHVAWVWQMHVQNLLGDP